MQTTQNIRSHRRIPLEVQLQDLLALFNKIAEKAITVGARSHDPSDHVTARALDDSLFDLRVWLENIEAIVPDTEPSPGSLKMLGKLEGLAASTFRNVLHDLETDLTELLGDFTDMGLTFGEGFRATCDKVRVSVDQLDKLQDALVKELTNREGDIRNMLDEENTTTNHTLSLLCFDGGGVRSYSSLVIFKALMDEIRSVVGASEENSNAESFRPCDVFNYIFGSSSGGLIAIMLGRLNMTDGQCMETFRTFARSIFRRHQRSYNIIGGLTPKYSDKSLMRATKLVIGSFDPNPESEKWKRNIFAAPGERCRCGVLAYSKPLSAVVGSVPYIFRTYDNPSSTRNPGMANDCLIWRAARATSAAPLYFSPVNFDGREFLDGSFGTNNPSHEAIMELSTIHPTNHTCLVSIGSSKRQAASRFKSGPLGRLSSFVRAAVNLATDTEYVHERMRDLAARSEKVSYFRFDVPGLENVLLDEWTVKRRERLPNSERMHTIDFIERQTHEYLAQAETRRSLRNCAQMVVESHRLRRESTSHLSQQGVQRTFQVPARNNLFHGREETLWCMYDYLRPEAVETDSRLRSCVLYGLRGIGKTQIAIEYIYRYKRRYAYVFWVQASNEPQLAKSYGSIAPFIGQGSVKGIPDIRQNIQRALHWLSSTDATWLLVFDDVDEVGSIMSYIPASTKGSMIITSHRRDVEVPGSLRIPVESLDPQSGASLLNSIILQQEVGDSARLVSELLGGSPLAIVTLGEYVNRTAISLPEYLQLYEDQIKFQLLDVQLPTTWQYTRTLQTIFDDTLASLSPDARNLVECMAFLDPDDIPEELFLRKRGHSLLAHLGMSLDKFRTLQTELMTNCLIQRNSSGSLPTFSIHRILKSELLRRLISDPERYQKIFFQAFHLIRAVVPHISPHSHPDDLICYRPTFATYIPHVLCLDEAHVYCDQTQVKAKDDLEFVELLSDVGLYLDAFESFNEVKIARRFHRKVSEMKTSVLGQEHRDTLTSMANLVSTYRIQGRWDEAEKLEVQVMKMKKSYWRRNIQKR